MYHPYTIPQSAIEAAGRRAGAAAVANMIKDMEKEDKRGMIAIQKQEMQDKQDRENREKRKIEDWRADAASRDITGENFQRIMSGGEDDSDRSHIDFLIQQSNLRWSLQY